MSGDGVRSRVCHRAPTSKIVRPRCEELEDRFLMYATTGNHWAKPILITYSFMPDGTSIGGVPSNLQATLNKRFSTASWQAQFAKAAAVWEKQANVNFIQVPDNGAPLGVSGNQQDDSRFGDIRIGGYAMAKNTLAFAYLGPPANGGTNAGDVFFNTAQSWQVNGRTYDLMTVAIHEFGHSLGMGHSTQPAAALYGSYVTTRQALNADDIAGIRAIYNARQKDFLDAKASNDSARTATNITTYIDGKGQVSISGLDSTTPQTIGSNDPDWYKITVPSRTVGTMVVRMQSTGLSLLSPSLAVYNSTGTKKLGSNASTKLGDTVTVTLKGVTPGQVYNILCQGATTGDSGFGAYGLQVNFGSQYQPPIPRPDTTVAKAPDKGGGTLNEGGRGDVGLPGARRGAGGGAAVPGDVMTVSQVADSELAWGTGEGLPRWTPLGRPPLPITNLRPRFATDQTIQNVITTMDFFTSDDGQNGNSTALTSLKNRRSEAMKKETVDRAIDDWSLNRLY